MQHKRCSGCSADLTCGSAEAECWCMAYAPLTRIIEGQDCLCEACLTSAIEASVSHSKERQVVAEEDYYIENGFFVFTRSYHLKRGTCCKNGCRHCPYGYEKNESS